MPTQSDVPPISKDSCTIHLKEDVQGEKLNKEQTNMTDQDSLKNGESQKKKISSQPGQQQQAFNGSPRRKFMNRTMNPQNGNRHNRNHSLNKKTPSESSSNGSSAKQFNGFKAPNMTQQQKLVPLDYQNAKLNGHGELQKKSSSLPSYPQKFRTITKSASHYLYDEYSPASDHSAPSFPAEFHGENSKNSHNIQSNQQGKEVPRKYSKDFLHTGLSPVQQSPKMLKNNEDMSLKMAFGDNSKNYGHFVSYGNQLYGSSQLMVQPSYQQQTYARAAYQQLQHQEAQRLHRMYQPQESYQRMYQQAMYGEPHPDLSKCNCSQGNVHQSHGFSQQQSYNPSPSYNNRSKGDRRDYRDNNSKKNRNGYGGAYQNSANGERNFNPSHKKEVQNRNTHLNKSHSFNEEDKRKNLGFQRVNSEDQCFRSLSPTPPGSSKSSSPGAYDKNVEKDSGASTDSALELVDDALSTASSGQSYVGEVVSRSAPELLEPEEPVANVSLWMDNHYGGSAFHNGLSLSAEHLSFRELPYTIIKRQPELDEPKKSLSMPLMRNAFNPPYDPQYPFDYYLSRSKDSVVLEPPADLKVGSPWDALSEQMWVKFREYQQSHQTYTRKMLMWRDLHNAMKVSQRNSKDVK